MESISYTTEAEEAADIAALTGRNTSTGLIEVHRYDQRAIEIISKMDDPTQERMLVALAKICALLHHNSARVQEHNQRVVKTQIQVKVDNIVNSYNGRFYMVLQGITGAINIAGALAAAGGQTSIALLGPLAENYTPQAKAGVLTEAGKKSVQSFSRFINRSTKQVSQTTQIGASVADNSAQAWRTEGQGHKTLLDNDNQQGGQRIGNEQSTTNQQIQQVDRIREKRQQTFAGLAR